MKKVFLMVFLAFITIVSSCADSHFHKYGNGKSQNKGHRKKSSLSLKEPLNASCSGEDCSLDLDDKASVEMVSMQLAFLSVLASNELIVDVTCLNAFGPGYDYVVIGVPVTLSSGSGTVSLVAATACTVTVRHYFDSSNTDWTPATVGAPLVVSISNAGVVSAVNTAVHYVASSNNLWLTAFPSGAYAAILYTALDPTATPPIGITPITTQSMTLTVQNVPAPVVTNLVLYSSTLNGSTLYTLTGSTSATGCKYIDNTAGSIIPTSWSSVNAFFTGGTGTTCPALNVQGNWTSVYASNKTFLIVFANTVGNLSSYTTYLVGP